MPTSPRAVELPRPTVHRLLAVLKRRGYVRQDEETQRYSLTLKMLDLSFRLLGRSELRLHAYPVLREYVVAVGRSGRFVAVPAAGEVTYIWSAGPDEVGDAHGVRPEMPAHCAVLRRCGAGAPAAELPAARRCRATCRSATCRCGGSGRAAETAAQRLYLHVRAGV